jgi:hypothetical protein
MTINMRIGICPYKGIKRAARFNRDDLKRLLRKRGTRGRNVRKSPGIPL